MESLVLFLKGLGIGFAIAAPVGPIALLCIRTTIKYGRLPGFAVGAGAAVADTIYGAIGVLGVVLVMDFINGHIEALRIAGGCFLIYLGIRMMLAETSQPVVEGLGARTRQVGKIFVSSFFLTITNPMTIFAFIAIFAGLGLSGLHGFSYTLFVIAGIFVGSLLWWLILSSMVYKLKVKISPENLHRINVVAGSLIVGFGVFALLTVFKPFII